MAIFAGKNFNSVLAKGEVPATLYGMSSSGWMDQELFADWFLHHFLVHAVTSMPLLLLDGHSFHYTLELVKLAQHHEISKDECAACFGLYEDDADSVEWIECMNGNCQVWCHAECLEMCENAYVCVICQTLLA